MDVVLVKSLDEVPSESESHVPYVVAVQKPRLDTSEWMLYQNLFCLLPILLCLQKHSAFLPDSEGTSKTIAEEANRLGWNSNVLCNMVDILMYASVLVCDKSDSALTNDIDFRVGHCRYHWAIPMVFENKIFSETIEKVYRHGDVGPEIVSILPPFLRGALLVACLSKAETVDSFLGNRALLVALDIADTKKLRSLWEDRQNSTFQKCVSYGPDLCNLESLLRENKRKLSQQEKLNYNTEYDRYMNGKCSSFIGSQDSRYMLFLMDCLLERQLDI